MNNTKHLNVARQFPEFFREEFGSFVVFVEEYYKYLDTTYAGNLQGVLDLDETDAVFLEHYRNQYAIGFPEFTNMQLREFIRNAKEFYTSKGTEKSLKFLFRLLFNEEVFVDYPGKYVLRASDGRWHQDYFFTLTTLIGVVPVAPFTIEFSNSAGLFSIEISHTEVLSTGAIRFYFKKNRPLSIDVGQVFTISENSVVVFAGSAILAPAKLNIVDGGKYWQLGQVITIPGTVIDTLARVTRVGTGGEIKAVEILQFGHDHALNQISIISPFPSKPLGSNTEYDRILVGVNPFVYEHTLAIKDYVEGIQDSIIGVSDNLTIDPYFAEDYLLNGYTGSTVFALNSVSPIIVEDEYSEITMEQWLESRATFYLEFDTVTKSRGYYTDEFGLISNKQIALQDNEFYQQFSYLIETEHDQKEYKTTLELVHPAGMKWFANLRKEFFFDVSSEIETDGTLSIDTMYLFDVLEVDDSLVKTFTKSVTDELPLVDVRQLSAIKYLQDSVTVAHQDVAILTEHDNYTASDYFVEEYIDYVGYLEIT